MIRRIHKLCGSIETYFLARGRHVDGPMVLIFAVEVALTMLFLLVRFVCGTGA